MEAVVAEADVSDAEVVAEQDTKQESPAVAVVAGEQVFSLPEDLYIPPQALRIFLEAFEGPLDLLLYLIRKHNLDILDIPVAEITLQYMRYIDVMESMELDIIGEYLAMAAVLAEIKSRMLLPKPETEGDEEEVEDPRAELVRKLQEYERFKKAAEDLTAMPQLGRDVFLAHVEPPDFSADKPLPDVTLDAMTQALRDVMKRAALNSHHKIKLEPLSIRERMTQVLSTLEADNFVEFTTLFDTSEGRMGVVVTFIAILELLKQAMIDIVQAEIFGPIHVKAL